MGVCNGMKHACRARQVALKGTPPCAHWQTLLVPTMHAGTLQQAAGYAMQGLTRPPSAEPIGVQLWRLGASLVGRKVMRYWPDEGGWWEAEVKEASPRMAKFR